MPLSDDAGAPLANDLFDGQEVEIVSWSPRARQGLSYQIRRLTDGSEWWIAASYLRRQRQAEPAQTPDAETPRPLSLVQPRPHWSTR